jgi:Cu-Zn family superoxide dismutase
MMKRKVAALGLVPLLAAACAAKQGAPSDKRRATARLAAASGSQVAGEAVFERKGAAITLRVDISGAAPGTHAAHIHEKGDCSAPDASSAGGHWNPTVEEHGRWDHDPFHLGDLGNIEVGADGTGSLSLETELWELGTGAPNDIVGKAVIVHAAADDFKTQPTGNAGGRIACGVIR